MLVFYLFGFIMICSISILSYIFHCLRLIILLCSCICEQIIAWMGGWMDGSRVDVFTGEWGDLSKRRRLADPDEDRVESFRQLVRVEDVHKGNQRLFADTALHGRSAVISHSSDPAAGAERDSRSALLRRQWSRELLPALSADRKYGTIIKHERIRHNATEEEAN